jgi:hypothetical protein
VRGRGGRPHRFEPARLVLGLALIPIAVLYLVRASGEAGPPLPVLIALVPLALLISAAVAATTHAVRHRAARNRPSGDSGD